MNRLADIRVNQGLSKRQMTSALGISPSHYTKIEKGDSAPSVYLALKISRILGVRVESIWFSLPDKYL